MKIWELLSHKIAPPSALVVDCTELLKNLESFIPQYDPFSEK